MSDAPLECREVARRLDDYVDRELSPAEVAQVATHLEDCARCARHFAVEEQWLRELKARVRQIRVPESLKGKVESAIDRARGEG